MTIHIVLPQAEGTLKPWPAFDAERDCEKLRKAMKGIGKRSTNIHLI